MSISLFYLLGGASAGLRKNGGRCSLFSAAYKAGQTTGLQLRQERRQDRGTPRRDMLAEPFPKQIKTRAGFNKSQIAAGASARGRNGKDSIFLRRRNSWSRTEPKRIPG